MNTIPDATPALPEDSGECRHGVTFALRLRARARILRQGWLQVFGIPDYERYCAHRALHHPGDPLLSRREYFAQAIDRKYRSSGPRCC